MLDIVWTHPSDAIYPQLYGDKIWKRCVRIVSSAWGSAGDRPVAGSSRYPSCCVDARIEMERFLLKGVQLLLLLSVSLAQGKYHNLHTIGFSLTRQNCHNHWWSYSIRLVQCMYNMNTVCEIYKTVSKIAIHTCLPNILQIMTRYPMPAKTSILCLCQTLWRRRWTTRWH